MNKKICGEYVFWLKLKAVLFKFYKILIKMKLI